MAEKIKTVEGQLLYPVPAAAAVLGIGERLMWIYIANGEIPIRKIGRRTLIARQALEKFAARDHEAPAKEEEEK